MTEINGPRGDVRWPDPPDATGDPLVDTVAAGLADLPAAPVEEHLSRYTDIHDALLSALDTEEHAGPEES
ncbi:hypothetical protein [Arthrobacter cupressi]|uniref:Uncharacterized protein n=1 Tax=Arthrobacter cupressi TaxID=1045773 RepID=A0A1G8VES9_9MICC|nr:hypothetical protein [Arthrobacter cupressi]NYD79431.1 hypothetical protein [Arthrobacter cupressi]SDJ64591.1 hypothetical protein SAMN05216555_1144 [Arthrobacter cupressi]